MSCPLAFAVLLIVSSWTIMEPASIQVDKCLKAPVFQFVDVIGVFPRYGYDRMAEIKLRCKEEYYDQTVVSMCHRPGTDNEWTLPEPECHLVQCPEPRSVTFGTYRGPFRGVGDKVVYSCDKGYWYTGTKTRICQRNGLWNGSNGECASITCGDLPVLKNGSYSKASPYAYGDIITVKCDDGYVYTGDEELSCFTQNKWTGTTGRCINKVHVKCLSPEIPHISSLLRNATFSYNASINITCQKGHIYEGDPVRFCKATGSWSGHNGQCKSVTCKDFPDKLKNGKIQQCEWGTCRYGDNLKINCKENFRYNGTAPTCGRDGKWTGTLGSCIYGMESLSSTDGNNQLGLIIGIVIALILLLISAIFIAVMWTLRYRRQHRYGPVDTESDEIPKEFEKLFPKFKDDKKLVDLLEWHHSDKTQDQDIEIKQLMTEIFDENKNGVILIIGKAGTGKSTITRDVRRIFTQENSKNVFLLNIRQLENTEEKLTFEELLKKHSIRSERVSSIHIKSGSLIIIDSLDQFPEFLNKWKEKSDKRNEKKLDGLTWVIKMLKREVSKDIQLVVSTRPFNGIERIHNDCRIEVLGLKPDSVTEFIDMKVKRKEKKKVKEKFKSHPVLQKMSNIPLICAEMCKDVESKSSQLDDDALTYSKIILFIVKTFIELRYDHEEDRKKAWKNVFQELPELAYQKYMPSVTENRTPTADKQNEELLSITGLDSGLLHYENTELQFVHPLIIRFFAMVHLAQQNSDEIKWFFEKKWESQTSKMALLYLFGLLSEDAQILKGVINNFPATKTSENRSPVIDFLFDQKRDEFSRYDELKAIQCIYETQSKTEAEHLAKFLFKGDEENHAVVDLQDLTLTDVDINGIVFVMHQLDCDFDLKLRSLEMGRVCQMKLAAFLENNKKVRSVSFKSMTLTTDGLARIMEAIGNSESLTSCSWWSMHLDDGMMKYIIDALKRNLKIKEMRIKKNRFTETAVKALADSLQTRTEPLTLRLDKEDRKMREALTELEKNPSIKIEYGEEDLKLLPVGEGSHTNQRD